MTDAEFKAWLASPKSRRTALIEVVARIVSTETTLYLSNRNYTTASGDTPSRKTYDACVMGGVSFSEALNPDGTASIGWGDIEIDNSGGVRDAWLDYVWANRQVQLFMGDPTWPRADFRLVFDGVVGDIASRGPDVLNLRLLDKLERLNVPISEDELGGSTSNKDRLIPLTFGECFNVRPLQTDPATLEYQFHNGATERIIEVRSNGAVPVSITKTLSTGKFKLQAAHAGTMITASVQGAKPGGTYTDNISEIVQELVVNYGPTTTRFDSGDLDTANLDAFTAANPQPVGLHCDDRKNVLEACQELAGSVGAQVAITTLGMLRLIQVALPPPGTPIEITAADIELHGIEIAERPPVVSACKLGYCRNWQPQENIAAGVTPESVPLYRDEWLTTTASDGTVAGIYKLDAQPVQQNTLLLVESDAVDEAERRRDLWKTPRTVYQLRCLPHLLLTELGDAVTITHSRFGLSGGVTGMVIRIDRDWLRGRITLGVLA